MFRSTFLTLFFAASAAASQSNELRLATSQIKRQLEDGFDIDAFEFNLAGVVINAEVAQAECPNEWSAMVSCVIQECPNFMDVCPEISIPEEFLATPAPDGTETTDSTMEDEMMSGNATVGEETLMDDTNGTAVAAEIAAVPECGELDEAFCETFGADLDECCLTDCTEPIQKLVVCIILQTTGEDRSDCEIPVCPTSAPGEETTSTSDGPKPEISAAVSVVSKGAFLVASLAVFAML